MAYQQQQPYVTIRARHPGQYGRSEASNDSAYGSGSGEPSETKTATHDISRVSYHVKHLDTFAKSLEDSATRAFPNRGRSSQRYQNVQALLLHWKSDDLFVLPELEDLERCLREDYSFNTDVFAIPSENAHLELMMRVGALIKEHESEDTLFIVYYGGHAKIDESRQSTWCATRSTDSPWLQWSAIQTLLERSRSDTLILLDCCAGAASATFPNGKSITETISASSWDAIAPDPGRYSFTNALIEVLQEWRLRAFSAAMVHAEVLARLKHPRPILINGKMFEARSTPVHFMMTANHKAPSIELGRIIPAEHRPPSPPEEPMASPELGLPGGRGPGEDGPVAPPNEDHPHVMISLALEDNQRLDLNAWEQWLASFPALAKYVKVQGVFKSHSTLLLLSMPVTIWDLLPEDHACSFVAFIRSNNLIKPEETLPLEGETTEQTLREEERPSEDEDDDSASVFSGTTVAPTVAGRRVSSATNRVSMVSSTGPPSPIGSRYGSISRRPPHLQQQQPPPRISPTQFDLQRAQTDPFASQLGPMLRSGPMQSRAESHSNLARLMKQNSNSSATSQNEKISKTMIMNQQRASRRKVLTGDESPQEGRVLSQHIQDRLEEYFQNEPNPSVNVAEFFASNLGAEVSDIDLWFHRRRQQQLMTYNLQTLSLNDLPPQPAEGGKMVLPGHLNNLLEIYRANQVLLIDLRNPMEFEKSHINGAVNLRIPASFIEHSFDLVELAFTDDQSRRIFSQWRHAKVIVFYDRVLEFAWECPVAEAVYQRLKEQGWEGQHYILKGHYREFSASFDKYITGSKMSQAAKDHADSVRSNPLLPEATREQLYNDWRLTLEREDRKPTSDLNPTTKSERMKAVEEHQRTLEAELEARSPALYRKAQGLRPVWRPQASSENTRSPPLMRSQTKDMMGGGKEPRADLVEPFSRGLDKLHHHDSQGGYSTPPAQHSQSLTHSPGYDKLGELQTEDYDEIDPREEQFRDDPAFLMAGEVAGDQRRPALREQKSSIWKRFRAGNAK